MHAAHHSLTVRNSITITILLTRELIRAALFPWHLLMYLPQRHRWRAEARAMLESEPEPHSDAERDAFAARAKAGTKARSPAA